MVSSDSHRLNDGPGLSQKTVLNRRDFDSRGVKKRLSGHWTRCRSLALLVHLRSYMGSAPMRFFLLRLAN